MSDEMLEVTEAYEGAIEAVERDIATGYDVPLECGKAVFYLRTRSRWTPEMEMRLVESYRTPDATPVPLDDVLSGEWR